MQAPAGFGNSQSWAFSMLSRAAIYSRQEVGENTLWAHQNENQGRRRLNRSRIIPSALTAVSNGTTPAR
jgi:hypothetical protein